MWGGVSGLVFLFFFFLVFLNFEFLKYLNVSLSHTHTHNFIYNPIHLDGVLNILY